MRRLDDWRVAFFEAIERHRPYRFSWGEHDCAILSADCIMAVTGIDLAETMRGSYSSAEEGDAVLTANGFNSTVTLLEGRFEEIHPSEAIVGDVAVIKTRYGPAVAPVVGSELAVFSPGKELALVSLTRAEKAFRVEIKEDQS